MSYLWSKASSKPMTKETENSNDAKSEIDSVIGAINSDYDHVNVSIIDDIDKFGATAEIEYELLRDIRFVVDKASKLMEKLERIKLTTILHDCDKSSLNKQILKIAEERRKKIAATLISALESIISDSLSHSQQKQIEKRRLEL